MSLPTFVARLTNMDSLIYTEILTVLREHGKHYHFYLAVYALNDDSILSEKELGLYELT